MFPSLFCLVRSLGKVRILCMRGVRAVHRQCHGDLSPRRSDTVPPAELQRQLTGQNSQCQLPDRTASSCSTLLSLSALGTCLLSPREWKALCKAVLKTLMSPLLQHLFSVFWSCGLTAQAQHNSPSRCLSHELHFLISANAWVCPIWHNMKKVGILSPLHLT